MGGDAIILACHFVFDTLLLIAIELGWFSFFKRLSVFSPPPRNETIVLDDDVEAEEKRVQNDQTDVIRVANFRKAY